MHKNATKCNETIGKWCKNKHGASKIIDTFETYQGTTLMIDNNSRGYMDDKFLRARIQLHLYAALRKRIILEDEITGEEVKVQICYERLPNFCLFCGYIGHMEARCDLPTAEQKINFNMDMQVLPVHFADPRAW
jgi:hypothetical protein